MSTISRHSRRGTIAGLATAYDDQSVEAEDEAEEEPEGEPEEFVIPEDLSSLSDADLEALHAQAIGYFETLYTAEGGPSDETLADLATLTDGIEALASESARRQELATQRSDKAAALAARIGFQAEAEPEADPEEEPPADEEPEPEPAPEPEPEAVLAAGARRKTGIRIPLGSGRRPISQPGANAVVPAGTHGRMREVAFSAGDKPTTGYATGQGMDMMDLALAVDKRLGTFNASVYSMAANRGEHMRERGSIAVLRKPFEQEAIVASGDPKHIEEVFRYAVDESRLTGGSLVAAGGWCAPSEILYDFFDEGASRDGLISLPEIQVTRGGIQYTTGPSFADIYAATGFCFTEEDDIAGNYAPGAPGQPNVAGDKPCYHIECPEFQECRMDVCGLCITAGLLQQRGYPEILAATVAGALIAHDHKMSARIIAEIVAGSTAVSFPANQVGATAPLLTAIELQVEHYRYSHRLSRTRTLEAVFPYWVRGAVRADLSRRLGVDLLNVSDAQVNAWFSARGVSPQFVYDWQALDTTAAGSFVAYPATVQFLLYAAGTWVRGSSDVITLDTIYDSVNLGQNDFTALFTEEGWMVCKRGFDSRLITVPICADGATHAGVLIDCNGAATPAP